MFDSTINARAHGVQLTSQLRLLSLFHRKKCGENSVTISLVKTEKNAHFDSFCFLFRAIVDTNQSKRYFTSVRRLFQCVFSKEKQNEIYVCVSEVPLSDEEFKRKMHFHYSIKWTSHSWLIHSFGRHHGAINHFDSTLNWDVRNDESFLLRNKTDCVKTNDLSAAHYSGSSSSSTQTDRVHSTST